MYLLAFAGSKYERNLPAPILDRESFSRIIVNAVLILCSAPTNALVIEGRRFLWASSTPGDRSLHFGNGVIDPLQLFEALSMKFCTYSLASNALCCQCRHDDCILRRDLSIFYHDPRWRRHFIPYNTKDSNQQKVTHILQ